MTDGSVVAVDLGASSGRVVVGRVGDDGLRSDEVHRFPNVPIRGSDGLRWDTPTLRREILEGLRRAAIAAEDVRSVAIDGWGVDYGLLDARGELVAAPFHYRDDRTARGVERVHAIVPPERLYERNGLQFLPFNTLYQLAAEAPESLAAARKLALMPDLVGQWLTGATVAERTNASTTGLLDARTATWALDLADELGLPGSLLPELADAGDVLGPITPDVVAATGLDPTVAVSLVGSHDTASAVVGVPAADDQFAYISCGTWGLVGVELDGPILTEASRAANFTNERGVDGRVRFLRNVMGLWLLQETLRLWDEAGSPEVLEPLLAAAAAMPDGGPVVDIDDPVFLPPGDMPGRIADACRRADLPVPATRPALVRCILDSLAAAFAAAVARCRAARPGGPSRRSMSSAAGPATSSCAG